jgi:PDZ domain-containing protein
MSISGTVASLLLGLLTIVHIPYLVEKPGPTFDLFDGEDGDTRLSLAGEVDSYDPSGELRLTTVSVQGGTISDLSIGGLIRAWLDPDAKVEPEIRVPYAGGSTAGADWATSQEMATVVALAHEGIDSPMMATITDIDAGSNAVGLLRVGDVILAINGTEIETYYDLEVAFDPLEPGDPVTVEVDRGGREVAVAFETIADGQGEPIMGIWFVPSFAFPLLVTVDINDVGGPSGGAMFALGIINLLTPEDELRGESVAGTGTIDLEGNVGSIGGIDLKMKGASWAGAEWFLAPESNCPSVVGNIPDGLTVVSVSTIDEAYDAIVAIGDGNADTLPSCG